MLDFLESADVDWSQGRPWSRRFGDIYGQADALAEARAVFIDGNRLPERLARADRFTVGETGFGTGLNFLAAWDCWRRHAPAHSRFHYLAVERYPLTAAELARALAPFDALRPLAAALVAGYPPTEPGCWTVPLDDQRVTLTLLFDDVSALHTLHGAVNAWFLDGFAPRCNPAMWSPELAATLFARTQPGGTWATFTAAGAVRRAFQEAGFVVDKGVGFHKRERLMGHRPLDGVAPVAAIGPVAVIGAGLAGAGVAAALHRRGVAVTVFDRHAQVAAEASGNAVGLVMPLLNAARTTNHQWFGSGFHYTTGQLAALSVAWQPVGAVRAAWNDREQQRQTTYFHRLRPPTTLVTALTAAELSDCVGFATTHGGAWYPTGGFVAPPCVVAALLQGVSVQLCREIAQLAPTTDGWRVHFTADGTAQTAEFAQVVLATGSALPLLAALTDNGLPLRPLRGQISGFLATPTSESLRVVYTGAGYALPAVAGVHWLGATYDRDRTDCVPDAVSDTANRAQIAIGLPDFVANLGAVQRGRAALRGTTPDHLPLIGPIPAPAVPRDGLWLSGGHGSRGLTSALLAGELLAAQLGGDPWPIPTALAAALAPARFFPAPFPSP